MGPVIGFVLNATGSESVCVSGDNASLDVVRDIAAAHSPVGVAVLFAGAVQRAAELEGAYLTLSGDRAAESVRLLAPDTRSPVHFEGWTHFAGRGRSARCVRRQPGPRPTGAAHAG
jgi:hypothetical protein